MRRLLFVLLGGMCMGGICGGGDPPRPDVCDGPMTRAPIDAIEIGQPGSTFQPLEDGYVSRVVTGPQGGSMLEFRLRVSGAQVPECVEQMITVSEQGRRIGALNTPLKTYPDAAGTRSTKSLFVIFESSTTMPVVTGEVTAEAGGKSVTKSITIRY